ncbi:HK97-gp10 family putative phage morphogenesis protein [Pararhizobium gei]|uniref:HK97-gp10 family putative phage morphogenesis protein n=1 Tax=Pararhizobium gei TaxID=1395951 RepID=UPI0023DB2A6F|nr:HK97-gp10 family putative phage morphogenesis protein [Rhizobium gei]
MSGANGIAKAFRAISLNLATPIAQASKKAFKPTVEAAKRNLDANGSVESGKLKKLITVKRDPKNKAAHHVGPANTDPAYREAHLVEFGTAPHMQPELGRMHPGAAAKPFLTPAFEETADEVLQIFGREIGTAIEKAALKAAAKATKR